MYHLEIYIFRKRVTFNLISDSNTKNTENNKNSLLLFQSISTCTDFNSEHIYNHLFDNK